MVFIAVSRELEKNAVYFSRVLSHGNIKGRRVLKYNQINFQRMLPIIIFRIEVMTVRYTRQVRLVSFIYILFLMIDYFLA